MKKCLKCGKCCKEIPIEHSPKRLKEYYLDWRLRKKKEPDILMDIWLLYPMLRYLGRRRYGRYLYRCIHLTKGNLCDINSIKPDMCKGYPWYGEKESERKLSSLTILKCGYNKWLERIKDEEDKTG